MDFRTLPTWCCRANAMTQQCAAPNWRPFPPTYSWHHRAAPPQAYTCQTATQAGYKPTVMGPLQLQHHCETAAAEDTTAIMDCRDAKDTQTTTSGCGVSRATIIVSSADSTRTMPPPPMPASWSSFPPVIVSSKEDDSSIPPPTLSLGKKQKKDPQRTPDNCKDDAYWEKRKRNNESAKRSRVLRRVKEQQTTIRVAYLEQENMQLRAEVSMLRNELDKMRQLLLMKPEIKEDSA